MMIDEKLKKMN